MSYAVVRMVEMLRQLPRYPRKITTAELVDRLGSVGLKTSQRTIQRDLQKLSTHFPIVADERTHPFGWSWACDAKEDGYRRFMEDAA